MIQSQQLTQLESILSDAERVIVIFGTEPTFDQLAVASALTQSLSEHGKIVTLASPEKPASIAAFSGLANLVTEIGNQNLTISFDYSEESVDKVSYHIGDDTGKFHLTIKPKQGHEPLDSSKVEFSYTGIAAEFMILIGVQDLEDLKQLYFGYEDHYRNASVISIANFDASYSVMNLNTSETSSLSEAVAGILEGANLPMSSEIATSLLRGIEHVTENFQSPIATADTFETIAQLMRQGAERARKAVGAKNIKKAHAQSSESKNSVFIRPSGQQSVNNKNQIKNKPLVINNQQTDVSKPGSLRYQPGRGASGE